MLVPWKESYDKPWHHFVDKGLYNQSYGFSSSHVWLWELDHKEGWMWKNWCFWVVVLEKTLESPWTARRSNQSILKEISSEYSLEGLLLKLKLQYFGHLMWWSDSWKRPWCWKRLKAKGEGEGSGRGWDGWIASWTQWTWSEQTPWDSGGQRSLVCDHPWGPKESDMT